MINYRNCPLFFLLFFFVTCSKEGAIPVDELLFAANGWYAYEYLRVDMGDTAAFTIQAPYLILGEYGSGFKIKEDGVCHINYYDGSNPIAEGVITRNWEWMGDGELLFSSETSEDVLATIVELTPDFLWIQYEQSGDNWEYKLRKIE